MYFNNKINFLLIVFYPPPVKKRICGGFLFWTLMIFLSTSQSLSVFCFIFMMIINMCQPSSRWSGVSCKRRSAFPVPTVEAQEIIASSNSQTNTFKSKGRKKKIRRLWTLVRLRLTFLRRQEHEFLSERELTLKKLKRNLILKKMMWFFF